MRQVKFVSPLPGVIAAAVLLLFPVLSNAQESDIEELKKTAPKVFIDCGSCDIDYIRTEITFVNYVRDRKEAHIHILVTTQRTGSGGREYTLSFMGQNEFNGCSDEQKYFSNKDDTEEEVRRGLVKTLKLGLMSYVARCPIGRRIELTYTEEEKPQEVKDKWDSWVFSLSGDGYFWGESSYFQRSVRGDFSAGRVTEASKISLSVGAQQSLSRYTYDSEIIESDYVSLEAAGLYVKSLNDHWSVGAYLSAESSTYDNIRFAFIPAPAVEYNLFPYSQATRRQLRFLYRVGLTAVRYREETVYDKTRESLWRQSLAVTVDIKEKWGSVSTTLTGAHYFHDLSKNRLEIFTYVDLNLGKGLRLYVLGGGARIHDQLSLPKEGATLEEVLLRRRQLETSFQYFFSVGLSFTFGSIYTNVVNPRFGSISGGGMSIHID